MRSEEFTNDIQSRLERTTLFVPASSWPMIEKAVASAADAICLDLEDSVAPAEKAASRANVIRALKELNFGRRTRMVRINGLDGPYCYCDVIEVAEAAGNHLELVMIPKVESSLDIKFIDRLLTQVEENCGIERRIGIEAQIETAAGFVAPDIAGRRRAWRLWRLDRATLRHRCRCPFPALENLVNTMRCTQAIAGMP